MSILRSGPLSAILLIILSACISLIVHMQITPAAVAQLGCNNPPTSTVGIRESWPPAAPVRVNIDSTFTDVNQRDAIKKGFDNWTAARGARPGNCSAVAFGSFSNNPVDPAILTGGIPPSNTVNVVKRTDDAVTGSNRLIVGADGRIDSTVIYIPRCKTDLTSFKSTTAHEVGHSFGLGDCKNCKCDGSVMATACPTTFDNLCNAVRGSVVGPTYCDNTVVSN